MAKLPTPRFNLRSSKSKTLTLIMLVFRYRGKKLTYSTGLSILPSEWNFNIQRPFTLERRKDLWAIKTHLDALANECQSIYIDANFGAISIENFKKQLDSFINQDDYEKEVAISFFDFIQDEIDEMKDQGMKPQSRSSYERHAKILHKFSQDRGKWNFDDVDWNFRSELIDWLETRNVQLGYGNKTLSILRQFLERARRKGLHSNTKYQGFGWLVSQRKAVGQKVILHPEELQTLADLRLHRLREKVRDLFLIGAGTGQRFSDYSKYTSDNFYRTLDGTPLLSIISQKTATPAKIPLNIFPWLIPTLEKYDYTSPKVSMQKLNVIIKELCKEAGIDGKVLKVEQYMGRKARIEKSYEAKYKLVSSHTCRRSFATNLYRMGYSLGQIMPMTGHATETQLRTYIGIDAEENALAIARSIEQRRSNQ